MTVYDRWHLSRPNLDDPDPAKRDQPCKCGKGRNKLYPSKDHPRPSKPGEKARKPPTRWQVRWYDEVGKQCKRNFEKKGGHQGEDDPEVYAEAYDAKVNAELDAGTYVDPALGGITLEQYCKEWRKDHVADPSTLETIDKHLAHIYDVERTERTKRAPGTSPIGHRTLKDLAKSPSAMRRWIKSLETKGLSAAYIGQIGTTLASILNVAVDDGRMSRNPMHAKSVKLPERPERLIRPWTVEMVKGARAEIDDRHDSGAIVDLGVAGGLRESEIFAFAEEDIIFLGTDRKILVRRQIKRIKDDAGEYQLVYDLPKGGKEREVPLSDWLSIRLAAQIKKRPPVKVTLPWRRPDGKPRTFKLLFVGPGGNPWYRQSFQYTWNAARQAAGAPPPPDENGRIHGLRHTFASIELAGGADILKLAAWLGHTDPAFTLRIYGHLMPDVRDVGRQAVDAWFSPPVDRPNALRVPSGGP